MAIDPARILIRATLVVRDVYTCRKCGAKQVGDAHTIETIAPADVLSNSQPKPVHMPVGWGSYLDGFDCPAHH